MLSAEIADETRLERVAGIIGDASTTRQALSEAARRRAAGEDVMIYQVTTTLGMTLVVGPAMEEAEAA